MSVSKLITANTANDFGDVCEWGEIAPKPFVLRGNAELDALLDTLDQLGVRSFNCFCRTRNGDSADVYTTTPEFKKGVHLSRGRLEEVRRATSRVGDYVWKAVVQAVEETGAEGYDLLIEACVVVSHRDFPRGIDASVTAFYARNRDFADREIPLL
jgi:hypothetical protein